MSGDAQPLSRRARIMLSVIIWLPLSLMLLGFFLWAWWFGALMTAIAMWLTYDYIRRGDMAGHVERTLSSGAGLFGQGATHVLGHDEKKER